jgi:hypothetical protein
MSGSFDPVRYNNSYAAEVALVKKDAMPFAAGFKVGAGCRQTTPKHGLHFP